MLLYNNVHHYTHQFKTKSRLTSHNIYLYYEEKNLTSDTDGLSEKDIYKRMQLQSLVVLSPKLVY